MCNSEETLDEEAERSQPVAVATRNNMQQEEHHPREDHAIQESLLDVERQLDYNQSISAPFRSAGRAIQHSISSALRNIRHRLEQQREHDGTLWDRFRQAEMAHSNRIPLSVLQGITERRRSVSSTNNSEMMASNHGDSSVRSSNGSPKREDDTISPEASGRVSTLLASRLRADHLEAPDRDLHSSHAVQIPRRLLSATGQHDDNEEDRPNVLLTKKSRSSLDIVQEQILFPDVPNLSLTPADEEQSGQQTRSIYSWGSGTNSFHDDRVDRTMETALVQHPRSIQAISVGDHHIAGVTASGTVYTAGHNLSGEVDPTTRQKIFEKPILVESLPFQAVIVAVSCGHDHTAALRSNGNVLTWGGNEYGQLGHRNHSETTFYCRPAVMALGPRQRATAVACGDGFTLCLTSRMELLACGVPEIAASKIPKAIPALKTLPIVKIAAGRRHALAVTSHGTAFAWGDNDAGQCGQAFPDKLTAPVMIHLGGSKESHHVLPVPLSSWTRSETHHDERENRTYISIPQKSSICHAACGNDHTILVSRSGSAYTFGSNADAQLGVDPSKFKTIRSPKMFNHSMAPQRKFLKAEAGSTHTILLDEVGDVWQMGNGQCSCQRIIEGQRIQTIGAGGDHSVAISGHLDNTANEMSESIQKDEELQTTTDCVEGLLAILAGQSGSDADLTATKLTSRTQELLCTPAVLNSLFMNPNDLDDLFKELLQIEMPGFQQAVASSIERGMMRGLESIREDDEIRLMWPEQVRFLLLILQCPLFSEWKTDSRYFDRRGDLMLSLCDTILSLPYEGYRAFVIWATHSYNAAEFKRLILKPLHSQLSKCLSVDAGAERRPMKGIVSIMKWLHSSSQKTGGVGKAVDFYNYSVCNMDINILFQDLYRYKQSNDLERKANFFFSAYPFLMSPSTKRNLLQSENQMRMIQKASSDVSFNAEGVIEFRPYFVMAIDREYLLQQTLDKIARAQPGELQKKLKVIFKGEDGVDGGGITREFFQLLTESLFDQNTGMWTSRYGEETTWFNGDCFWNDEGYYLSGVLVGLAVYNSVLLDVTFPQALYRKLLGLPLGLEDMIDEQIKSGLHNLLEYEGDDVEDVFCLNFDVSWSDLGEEKRKELKPGGSSISVTSANKEEYVLLYVRWLLVDSVRPQYEAFESGFMKVMDESSLDLMSSEELELLVVGSRDLDFEALEKRAEYEGGYESDTPVVRNLWNYLKNASRDEQVKFLKFTTGSSKAPIGGLGAMQFKVQRAGPDGIMLPTSHTCFNTLLLPDYGDAYDKLSNLLGRAIMECEGFGLQ